MKEIADVHGYGRKTAKFGSLTIESTKNISVYPPVSNKERNWEECIEGQTGRFQMFCDNLPIMFLIIFFTIFIYIYYISFQEHFCVLKNLSRPDCILSFQPRVPPQTPITSPTLRKIMIKKNVISPSYIPCPIKLY